MLRKVAAYLPLAALLVGCGDTLPAPSNPDQLAKETSAAVAAVYANTPWLEPGLHGTLALIQRDGSFTVVPTSGMYAGTPRAVGSHVYFSDQKADYRLGPDGLARHVRSGPVDQIDQWGEEVDSTFVSVFNSGTRKSKQYNWDVSAWSRGGQLSTTVHGEVWGFSSCGAAAYLLVGPWNHPEAATGARVLRLTVGPKNVAITNAGEVANPGRASQYSDLSCAHDESGPELIVLRRTRGETFVGRLSLPTLSPSWVKVDNAMATGGARLVAEGGRYLFIDRESRSVWSLDSHTGHVSKLFDIHLAGSAQYSLAGHDRLLVLDDAGSKLALLWYDLSNGHVVRRLNMGRLASYFEQRRENVDGPPASMG